jgi:hypothetical protein
MATSDGTWTHETKQNGIVVSTVTGRDPRATIKKLSPIWWVYNSDDPIPPLESGPPMTARQHARAGHVRRALR